MSTLSTWTHIRNAGDANAPSPTVEEGFSSWRGTSLEEKGEGPAPTRRRQVPHPTDMGSSFRLEARRRIVGPASRHLRKRALPQSQPHDVPAGSSATGFGEAGGGEDRHEPHEAVARRRLI